MLKNGVAITGIIGSGKSAVDDVLLALGYEVLCADKVAHFLLDSRAKDIARLFGESFVDECGRVDRKALGALVFQNSEQKKRLESFIHPLIYEKIMEFASLKEQENKLYFVDIPLFFESGGRQKYDFSKVLLVYAPKELCLKRVMSRDNCDESAALARLNAQMDIELKRSLSDEILENTGSFDELKEKIKNILKRWNSNLEFQNTIPK